MAENEKYSYFRFYRRTLNQTGCTRSNDQTNRRQTVARQGNSFIHEHIVRQKHDDACLMHIYPDSA
ncbi:hypothetical protein OH687_18775 [Burkholderia anthina]|nr:hypothetical protein OH687_18775 [Burkholderia anthina]